MPERLLYPFEYRVIADDPANHLFLTQKLTPYYEDDHEIILPGPLGASHHIKKSGTYFTTHLKRES